MTTRMRWFYGVRDRNTRWEHPWRRCPKCGGEDFPYKYPNSGHQYPKACIYCGWKTGDA